MRMWKAARTVVFNEEGKTAIIDVRGGEYYKIPGGGINPGEGKREAAIREAKEEAGCDVEILSKLGDYEFIGPDKRIYRSTCYLARKVKDNKDLNFTDWEQANNFKLMWVGFEEAIKLFKSSKTKDVFGKDINKRDLSFLKMGFKKYSGIKKSKVV